MCDKDDNLSQLKKVMTAYPLSADISGGNRAGVIS